MNRLEDLIQVTLLDHEDEAPHPTDLLDAVTARSRRQRRRVRLLAGTALTGVAALGIAVAVTVGRPGGGGDDVVGVTVAAARTAPGDCPGLLPPRGWPSPTPGHTPMNNPKAEALAQAIGNQGRTAFSDVYSTLIVDQPYGRVALCVTDLGGGRRLAAAAKLADPSIDLSRLDLFRAPYTERQARAAMDRIMARNAGYSHPIYALSFANTASGLTVTTDAAGAASTSFRLELERIADGMRVTVVVGEPAQALDLGVTVPTSQPPLPRATGHTVVP